MQLCRLRFVTAEPDALGDVLSALAGEDVTPLDVDVQPSTTQLVGYELVVAMRRPLDLPHVALVVERTGGRVAHLRPVSAEDVSDRVSQALRWGAGPEPGDTVERWLAEAAAGLLDAELSWVATRRHPSLAGVAATAMESWAPSRGRQVVARLSSAPAWLLAVPLEIDGDRRVVVVARLGGAFGSTDTDRLVALVAVAAASARSVPLDEVRLEDGGCITIRRLGPADRPALLRMQARCSPEVLGQRPGTSTAVGPAAAVERLLEPDSGPGVGLVAAVGSEVVAAFRAVQRPGAGGMGVVMLVEDSHQRRGIGGAMFRQLAGVLAARGVAELVLDLHPGDARVLRLVASCCLPARPCVREGEPVLRVACRPRSVSLAG